MASRRPPLQQLLLLQLPMLLGAGGGAPAGDHAFCDPTTGEYALPPSVTVLRPLHPLAPAAFPVARAVCDYLAAKPASTRRRLSLGRWTEDMQRNLAPLAQRIEDALARDDRTVLAQPAWLDFKQWVDRVAFDSEAFELRALSAPIHEEMWAQLTARYGVLGTIELSSDKKGSKRWCLLSDLAVKTLQAWKQAGLPGRAERLYQRMLEYEEGEGVYPYR